MFINLCFKRAIPLTYLFICSGCSLFVYIYVSLVLFAQQVDAPSLPSRRTTDLVPNNSHINIPPKTVMLNSSAFPPTLGLSQRQQQEPSPPTHPTNVLPLATSTTTTLAVTVNAQNSPQPPQHSPTLSSSSTSSSNNKLSPHAPLRRGKWTMEEEAYVARVIQDFNSGFLSAPPGTTLRSYLSEKLHCDPMRITKKFTGDSCIGKRVFHPAVRCASNSITIDKAQVRTNVPKFLHRTTNH